ncbi:NAD-dependent epimerase/dehydratase family protein [Polymorphobacter sp. PAMC 29334]|uniref:NAD-dependent epimerase/dehydratase family protein n=1 Tax=Polymorphobacter sp. PAMC 29334 TaxID=2862331 RepID=UPI001C763AB4|nr:NAD-dependent epimerase/dehydratase family protein [Polymorphobacter sp. PAMC 29334]QYE35352.1 NAD-dependent epimerase/dehydratase family protein [Polymorphobacter sp. PAMC 29334]
MTVLVTGVAGFIGFHTAQALLARGETVIGIDNVNDYYDPQLKRDRLDQLGGDFIFDYCDFSDFTALTKVLRRHSFDRIVHLGAQAGVGYSLKDPHSYVRSNLAGHLNLLEIARTADGLRHMVYASSSSVYGANTKLPFAVDDRADNPVSLYAATKRADELMSESYAHLFAIPLTGLRFFTVYGPWGRPDMAIWRFTERILKGIPIELYNAGRMRRDFTYIDDIVGGVLLALDCPHGGEHRVYNLGNSRSEDLAHLVELIESATGKAAIRELLPMQPGDVRETYADIAATTAALGFVPTTSIETGIPKFVDWFRNYTGL